MDLHIEILKKRWDAINQHRVNRALALMNSAVRRVYSLLPLFLHYHHSSLPGYLEDQVPHGINAFRLNKIQWAYLNLIQKKTVKEGKSFHLSSSPKNEISGLYSMGSTASMGQNSHSDLDIWVCHSPFLEETSLRLLQKKCEYLQNWAVSMGADVRFFLVSENRFRSNEVGNMDAEDCGSTQRTLLLDEFYRTAVRMSGKRILWHVIPTESESDYDSNVSTLYKQGTLVADEWLDLGPLGQLSAEEYFGAGLWQLYKSIDSPYKAVLKTLLLEAYASEYPRTHLLATEVKEQAQNNNIVAFNLDPYYMMLERVTRYLLSINDYARLDLARRCFYLKTSEKLSVHDVSVKNKKYFHPIWRRNVLQKLVKRWGWSEQYIEMLDDRINWKIKQVTKNQDELLHALMQSYQRLIAFARRNKLMNISASPRDVMVLTRKLYAAFETLPGKVSLVNPQTSADLSEAHLTFIYVPESRTNAQGWYLYNRAPDKESIFGHRHLEYHVYLNKLVAWALFNGLLTRYTQLHIRNHPVCDLARLTSLVSDIANYFPIRSRPPTAASLSSPSEVRHLAILVNLEEEPPNAAVGQFAIASIDLLYRNSWNEIHTMHFQGQLAMINALKAILEKMHRAATPPDGIEVFCYSKALKEEVVSYVRQWVSECILLRLSSVMKKENNFKILQIAGQVWGVFFENLKVSIRKLDNAIEFYLTISKNKRQDFSINLKTGKVSLPIVLNSHASEGITQFFFEDTSKKNGFHVYVLDESNEVAVYRHCEGCKEKLVQDVSLLYSFSHKCPTQNRNIANFNLPQFYQITGKEQDLHVLPFC